MIVQVRHRTDLSYDRHIGETVMELRLQPAQDAAQRCHRFELQIDPPGHLATTIDAFGNTVHHFNYFPPHQHIAITAESVVETWLAREVKPPDLSRFQFLGFDGPVLDLDPVVELAEKLEPRNRNDPDDVDRSLVDLTNTISARFRYEPGITTYQSTISDLITKGAGVCQDFAHFWIAACRAMGIPARYVSGYLHQAEASAPASTGQATHAWAEAWIPGLGWRGYDPTNPILVTPYHVKIAVGRDYRDVPPTKGIFLGPAAERVSVDVETTILDSLPPAPALSVPV